MRIIQVCHRYHPHVGGIETHVKEISERLAKYNLVEVVCADLNKDLPKKEKINGVQVTRFRSFHPYDAYYFSPQMGMYLQEAESDLIHAHNYHAFPAFFASKVNGPKFVFTPHFHGIGSTFWRNLLHKPYRIFGAGIVQRADWVICVSEYEKGQITGYFPSLDKGKISVIPNGIDLNKIRQARPFSRSRPLILYIGRMDRYKNVHLVVEAMGYLPDIDFYIVGRNGDYRKEIESKISRLHLEDRVRILDMISNEEKYRWLKSCSLLINLSSIEAFGITVLEALAAGKPVIINNVGGLKELAENFKAVYPIMVKPNGGSGLIMDLVSAIKENMDRAVKDDLCDFDWEIVVQRIANAYEKA